MPLNAAFIKLQFYQVIQKNHPHIQKTIIEKRISAVHIKISVCT